MFYGIVAHALDSPLPFLDGHEMIIIGSYKPCHLEDATIDSVNSKPATESPGQKRWAIAFHGGAGNLPRDIEPGLRDAYERSMRQVLDAGKRVLAARGTALDAVEAGVIVLEDSPLFNAGKGAYFTLAGTHELDASIMDGASRRCGAVAGVQRLKNPVKGARLVMERTRHVLLAGPRADAFAIENGCQPVSQDYFFTERAWQVLQTAMSKAGLTPLERPAYEIDLGASSPAASTPGNVGGTVGCIALDVFGNCAAATSTGGAPGKWPGRIGDSPIIGAGNLATPDCAVSCTGQGEEFIRYSIAARIAWLVEDRLLTIDEAVGRALRDVLPPGVGGIIAVDARGNVSMLASTTAMPRGVADSTGRDEVAIWFHPEGKH